MVDGAPVQVYLPGDSIRIQLTVEHQFDFSHVNARFENEPSDPDSLERKRQYPDDYIIELTGYRDRSTLHATTAPPPRSVLTLTGKAPANKAFGEYQCTRIWTEAPGGSSIPFEFGLTPEIRFRLIPEPVESPKIVDWEFRK